MSREMHDLTPAFQEVAQRLVEGCFTAQVPVTIITTLRTELQQRLAVRDGVSWTMHSKHLPQPPDGKSWAIDLVPSELIATKNWSPTHEAWWIIARAAVNLGLRSGMDWDDVGLPPIGHSRPNWDPGHCEWRGPK